jgi:hypothetical protein
MSRSNWTTFYNNPPTFTETFITSITGDLPSGIPSGSRAMRFTATSTPQAMAVHMYRNNYLSTPTSFMTMDITMRITSSFAATDGAGIFFTPWPLSGSELSSDIDGFNFTITSGTITNPSTVSSYMMLVSDNADTGNYRVGPTMQALFSSASGSWVHFQIGVLTNLYNYDRLLTANFFIRWQAAGSSWMSPGSFNWTSWQALESGSFTFNDPYQTKMWSYDAAHSGIKDGGGLYACFGKRWNNFSGLLGSYVEYLLPSIRYNDDYPL